MNALELANGKTELKLKCLGSSDKVKKPLNEIKMMVGVDEDSKVFTSAVSVHIDPFSYFREDNTAIFFYDFNEVSRSKADYHGQVTEI